MVKLTHRKMRRMNLGLRQIDVVLATGIYASRFSAIENELVDPTEEERERIEAFFAKVEEQAPQMRALPA